MATTTPRTSKAQPPQQVLVLQGGGALGAYQGGVYEALSAQGRQPDWVVGTSIGAINGAIIAGNPPERRLERLREFWHLVGRDDPLAPFASNPFTAWLAPWLSASELWNTITQGIPGFFQPRPGGATDLARQVPTHAASFYDTAPLRATLEKLVDFDYLNATHVRCTVCAVEVASGELVKMIEAGVMDPVKVTYTALQNAVSIATLILTTETLIADIPDDEDPTAGRARGGGVFENPK